MQNDNANGTEATKARERKREREREREKEICKEHEQASTCNAASSAALIAQQIRKLTTYKMAEQERDSD